MVEEMSPSLAEIPACRRVPPAVLCEMLAGEQVQPHFCACAIVLLDANGQTRSAYSIHRGTERADRRSPLHGARLFSREEVAGSPSLFFLLFACLAGPKPGPAGRRWCASALDLSGSSVGLALVYLCGQAYLLLAYL